MPSTYTTRLRLTLPATGELNNTWGNTVNSGITELLDAAIAGTATISTWGGAGVAYTLSNNNGVADEARCMFIVASGAPGEAKNIICPNVSKLYVVTNSVSGGFSVTLKTAAGTGISVENGKTAILRCDGTNVVNAITQLPSFVVAGGTPNQVQFLNASRELTGSANMTFDGTTLSVAALADASLTSGRVTYATTSGNLTDSANLTFDGTSLTLGGNPTLSAGTANGVLYLNGSKVATSGSALTWDGTNLKVGSVSGATVVFPRFSDNSTVLWVRSNSAVNEIEIRNNSGSGENYLKVGNGYLAFGADAGEAMRLNSTGLGIGTNNPTERLTVNGNAALTSGIYKSTNGANVVQFGAAGQINFGAGGSDLILATNGANVRFGNWNTNTEFMRLDPSGNLGIGTSSPTGRLEVRTDGGTGRAGTFYSPSTTNGAQVWWVDNNTNWTLRTSPSGGLTDFVFTRDNNVTEIMRLSYSGNLGLGVPPSAWNTGYRALDMGSGALMAQASGADVYLTANAFFSTGGSWTYRQTSSAGRYTVIGNTHSWHTAPSGTAGNTISFTQAMTLDASGNLLLNTTATATAKQVIQTGTGNGLDFFRSDTNANFGAIRFRDTTNANTNAQIGWNANELRLDGTNIVSLVTGGNERARIDSSGNLLVGATSNPGVLNTSVVVNSGANSLAGLVLQNNATGAGSTDGSHITINGTDLLIVNTENAPTIFSNNGSERARITSGGTLVVGHTAAAGNEILCASLNFANTAPFASWNRATSGDNFFAGWYTEGTATLRGSIDYNRAGGLVRYNTTSDYRAKDIIGPVQNPGAVIDALKVYEGRMKGATQTRPMLVAHEAQEVAPYAVSGVKDEVNPDGTPKFQQIDVSSLVPLLLAELQSLRARVAQLERH